MPRLRVSVNRLREGMVVVEDIFAKTGAVLVTEGTYVTKEVIGMLTRHFVESVMVEYDMEKRDLTLALPDRDIPGRKKRYEAFKETFVVAEQALSDRLKEIVQHSEDVDVPELLGMLNGLIEKTGDDSHLADILFCMKKQRTGLYAHSINVALLGQLLARWAGCDRNEIEAVSVAGLLHDIGFLELWKDNTEEIEYCKEFETDKYEKHVVCGYNIIKKQNIDQQIKQAILTHHERVNGSGFPLQVMGDNINRLSRIIAIADTYDTLTMEEGSEEVSAFDVISEMEEHGYNRLDSHFLLIFLRRIAETMIQKRVLLSDGREGKVIMINKYRLTRPLVQVDGMFLDLEKQKRVHIKKVLEE